MINSGYKSLALVEDLMVLLERYNTTNLIVNRVLIVDVNESYLPAINYIFPSASIDHCRLIRSHALTKRLDSDIIKNDFKASIDYDFSYYDIIVLFNPKDLIKEVTTLEQYCKKLLVISNIENSRIICKELLDLNKYNIENTTINVKENLACILLTHCTVEYNKRINTLEYTIHNLQLQLDFIKKKLNIDENDININPPSKCNSIQGNKELANQIIEESERRGISLRKLCKIHNFNYRSMLYYKKKLCNQDVDK